MSTGSINKFLKKYKSQVKNEWKTVKNCFILLSRREIVKLRYVAAAQLLLAALDFLGVLLIGFIGTLSVYGIQSRSPNEQTILILDLLGLQQWSLQNQVAILGLIAGVVLMGKTSISAVISRKTIFFLADRAASISNRIIEKLIFSNMEQIKRRSRFENMFALTSGVSSISVGVIGTIMNLFADFILIMIMFSGLLLIEPTVAISIVFMFGFIAWLLYKLINERVIYLASEGARFEILGDELLYELLGSYRELFASGLRGIYVERIRMMKFKQASVIANTTFVPLISKYVLEIAFVLGAILFTGVQFVSKDAVGAVSSITIFIASAGRIVPAILRIQNATLTFRGATSSASRTLKMIEELNNLDIAIDRGKSHGLSQGPILASVNLKNVSFTYADGEDSVIKELSLDIQPGEWVAVVGPSGSGKTTLIDLILGILKPTHGQVSISNVDPELAISFWPGSVTYVPQDSFINNGTIEQNVALGKEITDIDRDRVTECLSLVGLSDLVSKSSKGLKSEVGELGSKLSGGQRQRLGVARALYPKPKLLILDEATSSLDNLSERLIIDCLNSIRGKVTVISIAHRLSTVINSDKVIYIDQGKILASGSFNEVRHKVPNFDLQVKLSNIEEKKMRCIYLIIASSNSINLQDELTQRETWAIENKEVIWLRGGNENHFDPVSQTLFVDVEERYENILEKTIKGVKWCLENIEFDFLVRGNVSTYFVPNRIIEICKKYNGNHEFLGGYIDFMKNSKSRRNAQMFVSGAAIFLNRKAARTLTSIDINLWEAIPDDVAISQFLLGKGISPTWIPRCNLSTTSILTKRAYYRMKSSENGNMASIRMQNLHRIRKAKNKKCLFNLIIRFYFDEVKWAKRNYKSFSGYFRSLFSITSVKFRVLWLTRSGKSYVST